MKDVSEVSSLPLSLVQECGQCAVERLGSDPPSVPVSRLLLSGHLLVISASDPGVTKSVSLVITYNNYQLT